MGALQLLLVSLHCVIATSTYPKDQSTSSTTVSTDHSLYPEGLGEVFGNHHQVARLDCTTIGEHGALAFIAGHSFLFSVLNLGLLSKLNYLITFIYSKRESGECSTIGRTYTAFGF